MKQKNGSPFERDTWKRIAQDPGFAEEFFGELMERPLQVQISMLRKTRGLSQVDLAKQLQVTQSFLSKLEKEGSDHLVSLYERIAKILDGRLAIIPAGSRIVTLNRRPKFKYA